jgi:hypothetical protein
LHRGTDSRPLLKWTALFVHDLSGNQEGAKAIENESVN